MKKKLGLSLNTPADTTPTSNLLQSDAGKVSSQHGSIMFTEKGMSGASVSYSIDEFKVEKELGRGSFGAVSLVSAPDGKQYAMKEVTLSTDDQTVKNIYRELHSYIDYSHPYIVETINLYARSNNKIYVLQELASFGSTEQLYKRLKNGYINENGIGVIAIDTLRALDYIHKKNIIHRDIKPANLLMTTDGKCKLADFGVATSVLCNDTKQAEMTFSGSVSYMAPERFKTQATNYTIASDVWSLGISFIELLTGKFPYQQFQQMFEAMQAICDGQAPLLKPEMGYSLDCCNFINSMIEKDPNQRLTASQLLQMPFCKKYLAKEADIRAIFAKWLKDNCVK